LGNAVLLAVDALGRHVGIELEGIPDHGETELLLVEDLQRLLEMALADVAPGTDRIGDDVDASDGSDRVHGKNPFRRRDSAYTRVIPRATRHRWKNQNTALR